MMIGRHTLSAQSSNTLIIPEELRKSFSGRFFITQGFEQNLILFNAQLFEQVSSKFMQMSITDPTARLLSRMILGNAAELEIEQNGVLNIPEYLLATTKIQGSAILIGQGLYCEIWAPEMWRMQELNLQDVEANSNRFNSCQLCIA